MIIEGILDFGSFYKALPFFSSKLFFFYSKFLIPVLQSQFRIDLGII